MGGGAHPASEQSMDPPWPPLPPRPEFPPAPAAGTDPPAPAAAIDPPLPPSTPSDPTEPPQAATMTQHNHPPSTYFKISIDYACYRTSTRHAPRVRTWITAKPPTLAPRSSECGLP